jgi:hypothetical protein
MSPFVLPFVLRDDHWTDLGEVKWGALGSAVAVERELEAKVRRFPNPTGDGIGRHVFARGRHKPVARPSAVRWHSLKELYAGEK